MSPQRARTYGWLFVAMSASVLANLLLFQSRGDRAAVSSEAGTKAMRVAAATTTTPTPPSRSVDHVADTIRAIQRELKEINLYPGLIDGKSTLLLQAAIMAYEQAQALPLTGEPTQSLLRDLIVGPNGRSVQSPTATLGVTPGSPAERLILDVRQKLSALGYAVGLGDPRLTLDLIQAIRAFERDSTLPQSGRISAQLVLQIQRSAAAPKPRQG